MEESASVTDPRRVVRYLVRLEKPDRPELDPTLPTSELVRHPLVGQGD